jgi:hypothetical protein
MSRELENYGINILQLHVEWLVDNGYKLQASSAKKQIRMILINKKKKKQKATSFKLDSTVGDDRIYLERNNYGQ